MAEQAKAAETNFSEKSTLLPSNGIASASLYDYSLPIKPSVGFRKGKRRCRVMAVAVLLIVAGATAAIAVGLWAALRANKTLSLPQSISINNLMEHLKELEAIAIKYNNSRSVEKGYNASAEMVMTKLMNAGYNVTTQPFFIFTYEDLAPNKAIFYASYKGLDFQWRFLQGTQYALQRYSGSTPGGQVMNATLQQVTGGCSIEDFANFSNGSVALLDYNVNCSLYTVAANAKAANASAVVWGRAASDASLGPPTSRVYQMTANSMDVVDIPILGITYDMKTTLQSLLKIATEKNVTLDVQLRTYTKVTLVYTHNILATTDGGNSNTMIIVGSHLDSVPAGPGIDDNGSGVSVNLELALQVATRIVRNKVRFAFWSAEEWGLLGSYHYVLNLTPEEKNNTALNLNFDMLASPNFVRGVYNGSGAPAAIRTQCKNIQALFEKSFNDNNLDYEIWPFSGRSDYGSFIASDVNIPAGSIATGADAVKTSDERSIYGGFANAILDPCYHTACDTVANVDQTVLMQMATAAAYALEELMMKEDLTSFLMSSSE